MKEEKQDNLLLVHLEQKQAMENMWSLDNGANNHMYGDKDKFMELDELIKGNVTFTNHSKVSIK